MGDVAYALGRQRVANVAAFAVTLDKAPCIDEAAHHLADATLGDAEPEGQVLTGDHGVVGHEVQRPLLRRADAEGRRSLCHPLWTGQRRPLPLRRLSARPSAGPGVGADRLQCGVRESEQARGFAPDAKVPSFERVPRLHGNVAIVKVQSLAEPRRQALLPDAWGQDQDGAGTAGVVVPRDGPQPVVERPAPQGEALRTTPKLRPSWRVMVASKQPLRWNSTWDLSPSMPGDIEAARR